MSIVFRCKAVTSKKMKYRLIITMFLLRHSKTHKCFYNEGKKKNSQRSAQLLMTRSDPVMTEQRMRYIERDNIAYNNHGSICPEKTGLSLSVTRDGQLNRHLRLQVPPSHTRLFSYNLILHGLHNQPFEMWVPNHMLLPIRRSTFYVENGTSASSFQGKKNQSVCSRCFVAHSQHPIGTHSFC